VKYIRLTKWRQDDREDKEKVIIQARAIVVMEPRIRSKRLAPDTASEIARWTDDSPCTQVFLDVGDLSYTVDETPEDIYDLIAKATAIV
jgi:hypothetical protein